MNERIKELTAQLGEPSTWGRERPIGPGIAGSRWYGWSDHQQELLGYNTPLYDTAQLKKFAELIVRECAEVCYGHSNAAGGIDTDFGYGYKDCGDDIKRNFGVEE